MFIQFIDRITSGYRSEIIKVNVNYYNVFIKSDATQ